MGSMGCEKRPPTFTSARRQKRCTRISLMVVLGVAMIWFQTLLDDLTGLLVLTLSAAGLAGVLVLINRARGGGRSGGPGAGERPTPTSARRSATSGRQ